MHKKLTKGEKGYPADNSYSNPVGTHSKKRLGGTLMEHDHAVEVTVVSDPIINKNRPELEFIIVEFEGLHYSILNMFHESFESYLEHKQKNREYAEYFKNRNPYLKLNTNTMKNVLFGFILTGVLYFANTKDNTPTNCNDSVCAAHDHFRCNR